MEKMKVEIWSDIMCPFCYLGKRKFELALKEFEYRNEVEVEWKSFFLQPDLVTDTEKSIATHLSEVKGFAKDQVEGMFQQIADRGKQVGLTYNFHSAVVANSEKAHIMLHIAKSFGLQNEMKEALLKAYFEEAKNIDDDHTLVEIGVSVGLDREDVVSKLAESKPFKEEVQEDVEEARNIGVQGVPYFVFNRKYALSGAQEPNMFLNHLQHIYKEWKANVLNPIETAEGDVCGTDDSNC
jgi:protein disulfide-isomerase